MPLRCAVAPGFVGIKKKTVAAFCIPMPGAPSRRAVAGTGDRELLARQKTKET
jgi:hypothetical protein